MFDHGCEPRVIKVAGDYFLEVHKSQNQDEIYYSFGHIFGDQIHWEESKQFDLDNIYSDDKGEWTRPDIAYIPRTGQVKLSVTDEDSNNTNMIFNYHLYRYSMAVFQLKIDDVDQYVRASNHGERSSVIPVDINDESKGIFQVHEDSIFDDIKLLWYDQDMNENETDFFGSTDKIEPSLAGPDYRGRYYCFYQPEDDLSNYIGYFVLRTQGNNPTNIDSAGEHHIEVDGVMDITMRKPHAIYIASKKIYC